MSASHSIVPCFCQACKGKFVSRYVRRQHTNFWCDREAAIPQPAVAPPLKSPQRSDIAMLPRATSRVLSG